MSSTDAITAAVSAVAGTVPADDIDVGRFDPRAVPGGFVADPYRYYATLRERDPAQFADPARFDIGRRPNRHLSFGLGVRICAGNVLARVEGVIVFGKLFNRFPTLHLTGPAKIANRIRFREVIELGVAL